MGQGTMGRSWMGQSSHSDAIKVDWGEMLRLLKIMFAGYKLHGPGSKECDTDDDWIPDEKIECVKAACSQCSANVFLFLVLSFTSYQWI